MMEETLPVMFLDALLREACAALVEGRQRDASKKANVLVSMCPSRADCWMLLALCEEHEGAEHATRRAISTCPDTPEGLVNWAEHVRAAGAPTRAASLLKEALTSLSGEDRARAKRMIEALCPNDTQTPR